jgi:hypothetical protein
MRVLLIDPLDTADKGAWAGQQWDRVVDLGVGGKATYERWNRKFHCPISAVKSLCEGFEDFRRVRDLLGMGRGRLIDEHGLDWWEIMSILLHGELEVLLLMQRLLPTFGPNDEVYVSRPGLHASFLQASLPTRVDVFPLRREARESGLGHYIRASKRLSTPQMIDVFWDKYDSGYQLRGRLTRKRQPSSRPVTLLPTAYVNVSRTGIAYANTFPDEDFLLVSTRRSGRVKDPPRNVATAWLSSYASVGGRGAENAEMEARWQSLLRELRSTAEFGMLQRLGYLNSFPRRFWQGFAVRDAWRNVLDSEPVQAVLCADDSNPYTRIPLLLAQARGLVNIACHHGALDGRYFLKRAYANLIWAKGKMERDYLVRSCGVPQEKVEIAAPLQPTNAVENSRHDVFRPYILFISEAYDVSGGRPEDFYRDILPPLAELAIASGRTLIVKLHPGESEHERAGMVAGVLSVRQKAVTRIVSGSITEDLLAGAWFGLAVLSTVATECAIRGIPCFLCRWLEFWPYGYVEQFIRFGVGIGLDDPSEIQHIPEYLQKHKPSTEGRDNCYQPAAPSRLRELLSSSSRREFTAAVS